MVFHGRGLCPVVDCNGLIIADVLHVNIKHLLKSIIEMSSSLNFISIYMHDVKNSQYVKVDKSNICIVSLIIITDVFAELKLFS